MDGSIKTIKNIYTHVYISKYFNQEWRSKIKKKRIRKVKSEEPSTLEFEVRKNGGKNESTNKAERTIIKRIIKSTNKTKRNEISSKIISLSRERKISRGEERNESFPRRRKKRGGDDNDVVRAISIPIIEDRIGRLLALIYAAHVASTRP